MLNHSQIIYSSKSTISRKGNEGESKQIRLEFKSEDSVNLPQLNVYSSPRKRKKRKISDAN
jgi:hypothetical protein